MSFTAQDVVPISEARARLTELADDVVSGAEKLLTKNVRPTLPSSTRKNSTTTTPWKRSTPALCCWRRLKLACVRFWEDVASPTRTS